VAVIRALVNTRSRQSLAAGISVAYETISSVVSFTDEADLGLPNPVSTVNTQ
jgi:hypothetical protein